MNFRVLIMYSGFVDIKAREGHDAVEGLSVEYFFFGDNGEQLESKISADDVAGIRRGKSFLEPDKLHKVSFIPGIYDGQFEMKVGADGKPVLKLVDLDFVGKAKISMIPEK